ncbi:MULTISPECIES: Holliday junction branch migration protein RuvA [Microbacterium]|uniref:Holliday junction branch migration complex subunit RuvA n=3 Tax=Microbacterium maritypicum TaxID=33918 RepID=A0AAJ5VE13_MICMQ|nr:MULTISPECIES: Holliday junction branch migration protein RuvA [Microbacterium]EYT59163.1 ATP-dependent DNA helicase RuvA [Microbacterium sp. UCD-TDU]MBP5802060.1 Holliday junction branch migration protein RuvA [Microbacterium liquefaciens]UTT54633.1 Holliday junction branch migration protein RuvA [Microbacterium liquefaciens]WEF22591.1 Holliday junction branch migration protein RuvA [Microbacterium liquefaciens]WKT88635.1 Holliday junction branch migration protein RuvA [Microbacterium lique
MISSLHGVVLHATSDQVVIDVGGVGFAVAVPADVAHTAVVGEKLLLHTSLIVREDSLSLFGFADRGELEIFGLLISVTGVGPKSALGVLSHLTADQIAEAVTAEDDAPFRRVSGIGPKTAKLIVLQLAGKVQAFAAPSKPAAAGGTDVVTQVAAALVGLGWSEKVAAEAAAQTAAEATDAERASVASLLRRTLALLGPAQGGQARV